jgi:hypothetical protein
MSKKAPKTKSTKSSSDESTMISAADHVASKAELNAFLLSIRDKMEDETAAPLFALSALQYLMHRPNIYDLLDNDNREIARDLWLRIKKAGVQLKEPSMLF